MFRRRITICAVLLAVLAFSVFGCSYNTAKNTTVSGKTTDEPIILPGSTYVFPAREETFYCLRVKDEYYKFVFTGSSAELLSADDPSLFPVLEDGQFAHVTAELEVTKNDFGFVPVITTVSTRIVKLKSSEPVEFEEITGAFNLPSADSKEINKESKLFQYIHEGKLYLIFVYKGQVSAYSREGLFVEYGLKDGEERFERFFRALQVS